MDPVRILKFDRERHLIRGYPLQKKAHLLTLEVPHGAQFLSVEDQSHEGTLMLWVMQSTDPKLPKTSRKLLITYEEKPFEVEELTTETAPVPLIQHIGMWVDRYVEAGDVAAVTGHVLEILEDE